jgi:hypothetical protein
MEISKGDSGEPVEPYRATELTETEAGRLVKGRDVRNLGMCFANSWCSLGISHSV